MHNGLFITLEGIDGSGKSSVISNLVKYFFNMGAGITLTREPGGTELSEKLRDIILNDSMDPMTEVLLVYAARREHIVQTIVPALERGDIVISDRFSESTFAYQGYGRSFDLSTLTYLEESVQAYENSIISPDIVLWFDSDINVALSRIGDRKLDKFENETVNFFEKVRNGYNVRMKKYPQKYIHIPSNGSKEVVWNYVENALSTYNFTKFVVRNNAITMR